MKQDSNILQVDKLSKYFGGLAAVSNCSLKIRKGSITGIIGPNGSGKTTLFNLIAGNLKPSNGSVLFHGKDITKYINPTKIRKATKYIAIYLYFVVLIIWIFNS